MIIISWLDDWYICGSNISSVNSLKTIPMLLARLSLCHYILCLLLFYISSMLHASEQHRARTQWGGIFRLSCQTWKVGEGKKEREWFYELRSKWEWIYYHTWNLGIAFRLLHFYLWWNCLIIFLMARGWALRLSSLVAIVDSAAEALVWCTKWES